MERIINQNSSLYKLSRKVHFTLIVAFLFILSVNTLYAQDKNDFKLTAEEKKWIQDNPDKLVLFYNTEFPPIEFISEDSTFIGFGADIISLVEKKLGVKFIKQPSFDWNDHLKALEEGRCAIAPTIVKTPERDQYAFFTTPYLKSPVVLISSRKISTQMNLENLTGLKIGVVSGYATEKYLRDQALLNRFSVVAINNVSDGLQDVSFGQVDAFAENLAVAAYYISKKNIPNLKVIGKTDFEFAWSIGISRKYPLLYSSIQKALNAINEDEYLTIKKKWILLESDIGINPQTLLILKISGIFLFTLIALLTVITVFLKKRLNKKMRELTLSEKRYKRLADNSPAVVYQISCYPNKKLEFTFVNESLYQLCLLPPDKVLKDPYSFIHNIHGDDQHLFTENFQITGDLFQSRVFLFRFLKKDTYIWLESHCTPEVFPDQSIIWDGFLIDVTEKVKAEELLKENKKFLTELIDNSPSLIAVKNLDGTYRMINKKWEETTGLYRNKVLGKKDIELFPENIAHNFIVHDNKVIHEKTMNLSEERLDKDNQSYWYESYKFPIFDNNGLISGLCAIIIDITEQKRIRELKQLQKVRYTSALEAIECGLWDWDLKEDKIFMDSLFYKITGYENHEFEPVISEWEKIVHPDDLTMIREHISRYVKSIDLVLDFKYRLIKKDKSILNLLVRSKAISFNDQGSITRMIMTHQVVLSD